MDNSAKLEWMYKTGQDMVNREDYLLGKKVDKQFDEATGNSVESEVLPCSIGRRKDVGDKTDQVDIVRKQVEDPLLLIKQKEIEARRKILENPVKLKKLHELLKKDKVSKDDGEKSSKEKKKKKRKSSSSESDSDEDLDELLLKKYRALQGKSSKEDNEESNFIEKKFQALKKELDKYSSKKKKKSKHRKRSSSSSSSESSDDNKRSRKRSPTPERRRNDRYERSDRYERPQKRISRSPERKRDSRNDRYRRSPPRRVSRSPERRRDDRRRSRSQDRRKDSLIDRYEKDESRKDRNPSPPEKDTRKRAKSSSDSDEPCEGQKRFGLVSASGEKIALKNKSEVKWYTKDELKQKQQKVDSKSDDRHKKKAPLTEAEKEARRREMMENANWREKDRTETVKKSRVEEETEAKEHIKDFDKDFLNKHLKKAQYQGSSLEARIKSNLNSIQRSSRTMDSNFARR